jgi:hypothetical protein
MQKKMAPRVNNRFNKFHNIEVHLAKDSVEGFNAAKE